MMVAKVQFYIKNETTGAQRMNFNNNNITPQYSTPVWFGNRNDSSDDPEEFTFDLYASNMAWFNFEGTAELLIDQLNISNGTRFGSSDMVRTSKLIISGEGAYLSTPEVIGVDYLKIDGNNAYLETDNINVNGAIVYSKWCIPDQFTNNYINRAFSYSKCRDNKHRLFKPNRCKL